jgi:hypothetical protein
MFQSKIKVNTSRGQTVDKIIQGTSEYNPSTPKISKINRESSMDADLMISNYKKGIQKLNYKPNLDFISAKKVNRTSIERP